MPLVEVKYFNTLIDSKPVFDQPGKNKQEAYEKLVEMSRNNVYLQKYYKLIGIDLSRQTNTSISQEINFVGKLEEDNGATMFFIAEKQKKSILSFFLDSLIVAE